MGFPFEKQPDFRGDFDGSVRLFPLPAAVLFPHVLLPLHIFEPRYIAMTEDALNGDGLIALAQLKPGWEASTSDSPEILPVVCIGQIAHHVRLQNGRFNLMLQGVQRARIISELPLEQPFRRAEVEILEDIHEVHLESPEEALRLELLKGFRRLFPKLEIQHDLHQVFESDIPLSILCDVFGYSLQLPPLVAQQLLAEVQVERRCRLLLSIMEQEFAKTKVVPTREFPPQFSLN